MFTYVLYYTTFYIFNKCQWYRNHEKYSQSLGNSAKSLGEFRSISALFVILVLVSNWNDIYVLGNKYKIPHNYSANRSVHVCVLSHFSHVQLFATLWIVACQAPLSVGFSRQEYWSGLPWPSPGDLPSPEIELVSLLSPALAGGFFTTSDL